MSIVQLSLAAGVVVFAVGIAVHLVVGDLIRRIVALNVASGGVMLVLLALADRGGDDAPDPVPQAVVLTGIVVMAAVTGLALTLARRIDRTDAEQEPADDRESG